MLRVCTTTANFLPATAWFPDALVRVHDWSRAEGLEHPELLVTRSVVRSPPGGLRWTSVHEVWNPRDRLAREVLRAVRHAPQSRGMTPGLVDSIFFSDGPASERCLLGMAEASDIPAVVSALLSPVTGRRYDGRAACIQVHPDLGPHGTHLPLAEVTHRVEELEYGVVLDTNHVRRRVRRHPRGRTEVAPPLPAPGEDSLGGVGAVWRALGGRVRLVHVQFTEGSELAHVLQARSWPPGWNAFADLLPELAARDIPIVIEVNPGWLAGPSARLGLRWAAMQEILLRVRDLLARAAP